MNQSYWERTSFFKDADYVIIGAGIVGLFAALEIKNKKPSANVLVLERSFLPDGASTKNAGFACFGSLSELIVQLKKSSETELLQLVQKRWEGLRKLRQTLGDEAIEFYNWGGYEVFTEKDETLWQECCEKLGHFNSLLKKCVGENVYQLADDKISELGLSNVKHLIFNPYEAQIHSGKMMQALIKKCRDSGIEILFGHEVKGYEKEKEVLIEVANFNQQPEQLPNIKIVTEHFTINTQKVVICTNAFVKDLIPELEITPGRGQVFITKPIKNLSLKGTFHYNEGYIYFRNIDDRVLIGGGRNLNFEKETTTEFGITSEIKNEITRILNEIILKNTKWEFDMEWSGIMAFGETLSPIVKELSPNVYCAVRCNGMGVAIGSKVGEEVALLVTGD
jgi:glycine/D-amino acid oxidase-like deaminating enzyme